MNHVLSRNKLMTVRAKFYFYNRPTENWKIILRATYAQLVDDDDQLQGLGPTPPATTCTFLTSCCFDSHCFNDSIFDAIEICQPWKQQHNRIAQYTSGVTRCSKSKKKSKEISPLNQRVLPRKIQLIITNLACNVIQQRRVYDYASPLLSKKERKGFLFSTRRT